MSFCIQEEDALKTIAAQAAAMVAYHPVRTKRRRNRMKSGDSVMQTAGCIRTRPT